jgi:hypothetical protein
MTDKERDTVASMLAALWQVQTTVRVMSGQITIPARTLVAVTMAIINAERQS